MNTDTLRILINATAANTSGALSILSGFINFIETYDESSRDVIFYLFTSVENFNESKKVKIIKQTNNNWLKRIIWDNIGLDKWCISNQIKPDLLISFQNTCTGFTGERKKTPQLVYYHQIIPLIRYKWDLLNKNEFLLYLYAKFYGFFVNKNNRNASYVVQLKYMRDLFLSKFLNIHQNKVYVVRPNNRQIDTDAVSVIDIPRKTAVLLYPASGFTYKNHTILLKALEKIVSDTHNTADIIMYFTVEPAGHIYNDILKRNLANNVKCIGSIPFSDLLSYYKRADIVLFPSKIESFGLPLIEAAMFGSTVIASNLPYAKEVLESYQNAFFCNPDDENAWSETIKNQLEKTDHIKKDKFIDVRPNSWIQFMDIAYSLIK